MTPDHTPTPTSGDASLGRIAREDRLAGLGFALRGAVVLALLGLAVLGLEKLVLAYPARLGLEIDGLPVDRLVELRATAGQVVFIGDSVIQTVATGDPDVRMLTTMLEDELDGIGVRRVSAAATGAELHASWLRYLENISVPPRTVVIEINPRSFSPHWERNPGWVFNDQAAMIDHPLFGRLASVLEWDWERPTDLEYRETPVAVLGQVVGTVASLERPEAGWDPPADVAAGRYLVRYAADYAMSRRIAALHALVDEVNACPFPVVLFITPIDVEAIRARLTPEQLGAVDANLGLLRRELARSRWPTVDASEMVPRADFDHPDGDPHEHLRAPGRVVVAAALAAALRTLDGHGWQ
jgi:hypothetical protein